MLYNNLFIVLMLMPLFFSGNEEEVNEASKITLDLIEINQDSLELNQMEGLVYHRQIVFTGTAIGYNDKRQKTSAIEYLNGKKHGIYRKWFDHGGLSFEGHFTHGKQNGVIKTWWINGVLRSECQFENGIPHGIQLQWYKSGAKFKRQNLVYGQEQGIQQSWRENGKIYNNYEAKNGRIFGLKRANLCYELDNEEIQINTK